MIIIKFINCTLTAYYIASMERYIANNLIFINFNVIFMMFL